MAAKYKWRPATAKDVGRLARFRDVVSEHEPWEYGLLRGVECDGKTNVFACQFDSYNSAGEDFFFLCEVQDLVNLTPTR